MKRKRTIWIFAIILALLATGFIGTIYYCKSESGRLHSYSFSGDTLGTAQNGLLLTATVSKEWQDDTLHPDIPTGAQYDGVLSNDLGLSFERWQAVMTFSEAPIIDSSWNGDFAVNGRAVTFTAADEPDTLDDPAYVKGHGKSTFGAVMYSKELLTLESYTISGYRLVTPGDLPIYYILWVLLVLWVIVAVTAFIESKRTRHFREQQMLDSEIIRQSMSTFSGFIDAKDPYTNGHSTRVADYSAEMARRMKWPKDEVKKLYYISLMHDCGKVGVPDSVLKKPGKLTQEEYELIKSHTTLGDAMLVNFTAIPEIRDGAHYHHERYDGKGYPTGLKGTDIPLCARIIGVADAFDAMSSTRCYRAPLSEEKIRNELLDNAGKQFDPDIVKYIIEMMDDGSAAKIRDSI